MEGDEMPPPRIFASTRQLSSRQRGRNTLPVAVTSLALLAAVLPATASALPLTGSVATSSAPSSSKASTASSTATKAAVSAAKATGARTVTLLTGDKVTVTPGGSGPDSVSVTAADGGRASARITQQGGDVFVYPVSADPYVAAGLLDSALFNVTQLIADGYDDAHTTGLPLILSYGGSVAKRKAAATALPDGAQDVRALTSINSTALVQDHASTTGFWSGLTSGSTISKATSTSSIKTSKAEAAATTSTPTLTGGVKKIWLDGKVHADLAESTAQIGAPQVWANGNTGKGVDVAVLDTGIDAGHPDLTGLVASSQSFVPDEDITDHVGHGTHVASTIVGTGAASGGKERGVAPGATLHVGKVLNDVGSGYDSWIIAGMQWAARDVKARVISMSLGSDQPDDGTDPMSQAVDELSEETGALFTIAAGNSGPGDHTIASPGAATDALTVGAVDSTDTIADFSSRGPRFRDDAPKPEISAPGVSILAALSQYSAYPPDASGYYTTLSGTSMATPHVAGAATLVAAAHPDWNGTQIKNALVSSAAQVGTDTNAVGNGRVDAVAAAEGTLFATGTVDAGIHPIGGTAPTTVDKTVTWTNTADTAVTADLSIDAPDAPKGVFTLADTTVTVPAGGTASATVTTHVDAAPAGNRYTGKVIATVGGTVKTRTLVSVSTQDEPHHLKAQLIANGPYNLSVLFFYQRQGDDYPAYAYSNPDGLFDVTVPDGKYTVWTYAVVPGTHGAASAGLALLSAPTVTVKGDTSITLDENKVQRVKLTTPKVSTDVDLRMDFSRSFTDGSPAATDAHVIGDAFDSLWALPVAKPANGDVLLTARWRMQQPTVALTSGEQNFDDLWIQPGSTLPKTADHTLATVYAGDGSTADYGTIDAKGKIAVVNYVADDDDEDDDSEDVTAMTATSQIRAAEAEGVALLVVVNDLNGRLFEPISKSTLTVVGISNTEGTALIGRIKAGKTGSVPSRLITHSEISYLYDLVHTWKSGIPKTLTYAPTTPQLARVEVGFGTDPAATEVYEGRFDIEPYLGVKIGIPRWFRGGTHRTDWVTTGVKWMEDATATALPSYQSSDLVSYPAGKTTTVRWFGPFDRPRINRSLDLPARTGNQISAQVPGFGDAGANHAGTGGTGSTEQETTLYKGKTVVTGNGGYYLTATGLTAKKAAYRLVTTTKRTGYPYSTATSTEWSFSSAAPAKDATTLLPLLQLDYGIGTKANGTTTRTAALAVTGSQIAGVSTAAVRTTAIELSYDDGKTWKKAKVKLSRSTASTHLAAPAKAKFVSIRVHASDSKGRTVVQTIKRAVGLG
jgi:subtilisin family serine protease